MAINALTQYPGQISNADPAGYPYGKPRNITVPGDGTGTPLEAAWVSDVFGFFQALLDDGGSIVPSGTPDKVGASQYLTAIKAIIAANAGSAGILPSQVDSKTADYTIVVGDKGIRIELGAATAADRKFTLDVSILTDFEVQISFVNRSDYRLQVEVSNTGTMKINDIKTDIMIWKGDGVVTLNGDTSANCNTVAGF